MTPVGHVWPQLGEAAITGPIYFNVDFAQENLTPQGEAADSLAQHDTAGVATSNPGEDSRGRPQDARANLDKTVQRSPTRKDWCRLSDILAQAPEHCMQAKSAKLLDWIEEFEQGLEPDTLGYWLANRIAECLESDEEDTIGILACIEDLKVQAGRAPNRGVCTILQANVTQYRSEIKQWLVTNQCQIACLQETHVDKGQQNGLQSGLAAVSLESWAHPAEATQGGNSGGLVTVARSHLQTRHLHTSGVQGKGFVVTGIRFHGWDLAVGAKDLVEEPSRKSWRNSLSSFRS